jgi:serine/threonine protein kinase
MDPTRLPSQDELIGQILNGRYLIQNEIKRGGMGVVYLALDQQLHSRPVVIKVLLEEAFQSEYVVQKFRQEVEALSRIDHPGIVGIIDAGELENGKPFIIMQYVEGVTLRSAISPEGMNLERAAELLKQIGRALAAAHNRGILHRDLKPDNIMLQNLGHGEEQVKIIDFGIAKVKDSVIAPSTSLNLSPGTVAYMAPEQLNGRPITAATDIYALGAITYEMVTGRKPFNPETGFELLQMQQSGVRVKPADLRPSLPGKAQDVILKALSFAPVDRHPTPREFADAFAAAIAEDLHSGGFATPADFVLPPTQLSNEETPLAKAPPGAQPKTLQVPFRAAEAPGPSAAQPGAGPSVAQLGLGGRADGARRSKSRVPLIAGVGVLVLAIAVAAAWAIMRSRTNEPKKSAAPPTTERDLNYGLTVQKMRDGRPYQDPFESSGQEIFENGWKFRVHLTSPQAGYLYLLNEGPAAGSATTYNLLFAASAANSNVPPLTVNEKTETKWMVFDNHQGTERFWIIWAAEAVPELEAVKGVINEKDKGEVGDADQAKAVKSLLEKHSSDKPDVQKDSTNKQTILKGKGDVLVHLMELEHH